MNRSKSNRSEKKSPILREEKFWGEFFFRIGNGESLRGVSKDLGVPFQSVWSAIMADEKRIIRYEDARMSRAHYHSAKIEEILDDLEGGRIEPQAARVSIDARKWLAAKMYPKFFSDRLEVKHDVSFDVRKQHIEELRRMNKLSKHKRTIENSESDVNK
ncbi:MAG: hypothetical protein QGH50_22415 [SAR324 cluster bacterium]|jgi:hypothetical protein|nr:hypothetical protein [SAR324 cluster bacterium]